MFKSLIPPPDESTNAGSPVPSADEPYTSISSELWNRINGLVIWQGMHGTTEMIKNG